VLSAPSSQGAAIYAVSVAALFASSALYRREVAPARERRWMRRVDHPMIFVVIAGTTRRVR
jgi:hemolysin III